MRGLGIIKDLIIILYRLLHLDCRIVRAGWIDWDFRKIRAVPAASDWIGRLVSLAKRRIFDKIAPTMASSPWFSNCNENVLLFFVVYLLVLCESPANHIGSFD